jgi:hypothetical protein
MILIEEGPLTAYSSAKVLEANPVENVGFQFHSLRQGRDPAVLITMISDGALAGRRAETDSSLLSRPVRAQEFSNV